jgi:iron complex transport system permease protein
MSTPKNKCLNEAAAPLLDVKAQYSRFVFRKTAVLIVGGVVLLLLMILSVSSGSADLSFSDVIRAILAKFFKNITVLSFDYNIVWSTRLPRVMMAVVSGVGLSISGVQMQGITGNPLVSPFTVGISSAAALGASLAILFGVPLIGAAFQTTFVIMAAFLFAMANTVFVFLLSRLKSSSPATLVLAGTALTYLTGAVTSVLHFFASEEDLKAMIHWTFGTFTGTTWNMVAIVSAVIVVCLPLLFKQAWNLNAMTAGGDDFAKSLGINTSRVRIISLIISALITATIISFTGVIGFICLVAPHIARFIIGGDHRFLLPGACIFGAILTVGSDLVGRTILSPIILPISIVVSFVGVPLFLYLVLRSKNDYWKK